MKIIGITGGVGAGKSTVLDYLKREFQAEILQTDLVGHLVMEPGQICYERIVEQFGREILQEDGRIDRKKLGAIVFANDFLLKELNGIVHPAVKEYVLEQIRLAAQRTCRLFVVESALLFDDDYDAICQEVWYIYASEAERSKRLRQERGYSDDRIQGIMKNQAKEEFFRSHSDFVVENNGDLEETCRQIRERIQKI